MIDFDFTFLQPKTIEEAHKMYRTHSNEGKKAMYFNGGTEFISRSRHGEIDVDCVIDIKDIPDCQVNGIMESNLVIGAGVTLSALTDQDHFPLLSRVIRGIATKTARNKITIGGNLCSHLPYKEAFLPFLLAESTVVIATEKGLVKRPVEKLAELNEGEFLVQIITDKEMLKMPFTHVKRTRQSQINYPILTMATLEVNCHLRVAMSGLCKEPIRSKEMEAVLNSKDGTTKEIAGKGLKTISESVMDDDLATGEYREFVCKTLLQQVLTERKETL